MDEHLERNLTELLGTLCRIDEEVYTLTRMNRMSRFIHRGSISTSLDEHLETLDAASNSFNTACLIAIRLKMSSLANYGDYQLRLFRWCDLRLQSVPGRTWTVTRHAQSEVAGYEWDGEWDGRAVAVRVVHPKYSGRKDAIKTCLGIAPLCHHPYVAQVFGYSHPSSSEKFYVLERGSVNILKYFKTADTLTKLRSYLRMFVEYQETFEYLQTARFPVASIGQKHRHDQCLPSLALKEDGTILLSAEDLVNANLRCLAYRLCTLFTANGRPLMTDNSEDFSIATDSKALLSMIEASPREHMNVRQELPIWSEIWCYSWLSRISPVNPGDYGYIHPHTQSFVYLGNVFDLLHRSESYVWVKADYLHGEPTEVRHVCTLDEDNGGSRRYRLNPGVEELIAIDQQLPKPDASIFFWFHAYDVATYHGIDVKDLVLIDAIAYWRAIRTSPTCESRDIYDVLRGQTDVYFHQPPLSEMGTILSSFGHWSLLPEPSVGPWPDIHLPGVQLDCTVRVSYAHLNSFQAELLSCFAISRRNQSVPSLARRTPRLKEIV
ncbi:hypothetical protein CERSUDRAFT_82104 [Gelatoporia subvermispora B]|uniref:Protein kinase domain-containing protein n=1 Tax=Ceriporiopsis subvermispora (strain B) TaxID=914234 RepID=M2RKM5_CERS8|nr:hypothetical protein CERSUDRAFT_82104 [Gelatoporia subvermispora B]